MFHKQNKTFTVINLFNKFYDAKEEVEDEET